MGFKSLIIVGAGFAFREHYLEALVGMDSIRVAGIVDPKLDKALVDHPLLQNSWKCNLIKDIPEKNISELVAVVLTPDHWPTIAELANCGFKQILVEKPLVNRDEEIEKLNLLINEKEILLYAIDFYISKLFPLLIVSGKMTADDPRMRFVLIDNQRESYSELLGQIEGISMQVIEAGDFCLPDLTGRPWLEHDPEIGGMLRDLGTHIFAPLVSAGLLTDAAEVHHVSLQKLNTNRNSLVPVSSSKEPELYATALLTEHNIPIQVNLGKVPFGGGIWSLVIRGKNGMFFAGLRTGQPSVLISNKGERVLFFLNQKTYRVVLEEAFMYFDGQLPKFDGNLAPFFTSKKIENKLRYAYFK